ncbi:MAG: hypothetical protein R2754_03005 [Microthrixaceae bacterium]
MTITVAFVIVVGVILVGGALYRRWDEAAHLRVTDEAGTSRAVPALSIFESRQVLTHPTWLITLALLTTLTTTLTLMEPDGSIPHDAPVTWFTVIGIPVAALALVVSLHRIGTRARRRTEEIEAATPTAPRARTVALLIACWSPLPIMVGALATGVITSQLAYSNMPPLALWHVVHVLGFLLAGVGGAVVGVLLARWLPFAVAPLLGIVAIIWLNNGVDHLHPRFRWLRVAVESDYGGMFDVRPVGWSAVFIVGLILLGACLAVWRHPARPMLFGVTTSAVLVIVATGWSMTRSPSEAEIADRVDLLERPTAHQHCESRGIMDYCVYPGAEGWIDAWDPAARGVLSQVPAGYRPARLEVVQRTTVGTYPYLAEVVGAVDPARAWPADGKLHPPLWLEDERTPDMTVAWQAAATAVGLPPATDWKRPSGCLAGGQARLTLAHLLAGRATATTADALRRKAGNVRAEVSWNQPVAMDLQYDYGEQKTPPGGNEATGHELLAADGRTTREYIAVAGATGWGSDLVAAELLMDADRARVDRAIEAHWAELTDPATPTSRLTELVGIDPASSAGNAAPLIKVSESSACP